MTNFEATVDDSSSCMYYNTLRNQNDEESWNDEAIQYTIDLWGLSETEQDGLRELKQRLFMNNSMGKGGNKEDTDTVNPTADIVRSHWKNVPGIVVRFLLARSGDVDAAEKMFRNMIQWRLENKADTILQDYDPSPTLKEYIPGAMLKGLDRENDPIYVTRMAVTDGPGLLKRFGAEELIRYNIWIREVTSRGKWLKEYEADQGHPVKQATIIEDLGGASLYASTSLVNLYRVIMRLDQDNYPETKKRLIIINTPLLFRATWTIAKHFFDSSIVNKMIFSGSSNYKEVLEKYIDPSILPPEIYPGLGKGGVATGMTYNFIAGKVPQK